MLSFTQQLIAFVHRHPAFNRRRWFQGLPIRGSGVRDIGWFLPDGKEMSDAHWNESFAKSLAIFLYGRGIHSPGPKGELIVDDSFYIIFNAYHEALDYKLPAAKYGREWIRVLDTVHSEICEEGNAEYKHGETITVEGRSIILLKHPLLRKNTTADTVNKNPGESI